MRVEEARGLLMSVAFAFLDFRDYNPQDSTGNEHARNVAQQPRRFVVAQMFEQVRRKNRLGCITCEGNAVTKIPEDECAPLESDGGIFASVCVS
jgi:hypothetical protein